MKNNSQTLLGILMLLLLNTISFFGFALKIQLKDYWYAMIIPTWIALTLFAMAYISKGVKHKTQKKENGYVGLPKEA